MRFLLIGDVMGRPGRRAVKTFLPRLVKDRGVDFTVANAENLAGGAGITEETMREMFEAGVDVLTTGNHVWDKKETLQFIAREPRLLRPLNYHPSQPGSGAFLAQARNRLRVGVVNAAGRTFMAQADDPFRLVPPAVEKLRRDTPLVLVDMHAEATSEKRAMGWLLDGKATAVFGTHTHVPTADEEILPQGTAYVTDLGMTGPYASVIGIRVEDSLARFTTGLHQPFNCAKGDIRFCAALVEADEENGRALSIERICMRLDGEESGRGD
jgi:hypothetical protein